MDDILELDPGQATASVIFLHGLGADGNDLLPVAEMLALNHVRFILPDAPIRPISLYSGQTMRAWFDLNQPDLRRQQDQASLDDAREQVRRLIEREIARGIPVERMVLAGFSQGGALALYSGLTLGLPLAGIVGLSTWLPQLEPKQPLPSLWIAHGSADTVIPLATSQASFAVLPGAVAAMHIWPIAHQISAEEIAALSDWLKRLLIESD